MKSPRCKSFTTGHSARKARRSLEALKNLADALQAPPRLWTESQLWQAYAALDKSKVKGENRRRILTDLVSLVRFAMHQDNELVLFPERVNANFKAWLAQQQSLPPLPASGERAGVRGRFTPDQLHWLEMIRDHIAANLGIERMILSFRHLRKRAGLAACTSFSARSCRGFWSPSMRHWWHNFRGVRHAHYH
jgi:type I restriction enzyme R subunit